MDIKEKAKNYAEGKALESISRAIQDAYAAGYKSGYNDGYTSKEKIFINELENGVEYVDLQLPSGTKWSIEYIKYEDGERMHLNYQEAINLNIPTLEQFNELYEKCDIKPIVHTGSTPSYWEFTGKNGASIKLYLSTIQTPSKVENPYNYMFWLKERVTEDNKGICAGGPSYMKVNTSKLFMGYKLPIMLVK